MTAEELQAELEALPEWHAMTVSGLTFRVLTVGRKKHGFQEYAELVNDHGLSVGREAMAATLPRAARR